jgi:bacillithiol biosynthesis deacetylase BshB1
MNILAVLLSSQKKLIYSDKHIKYIYHQFYERHFHIKLDALFFGAHPDDVELNCGGTVISLTGSGRKVGVIDLTRGELSTRGTLKTRDLETRQASKILGISFRENLKLRDGDITNDPVSRKKVISAIRKVQPEVIFAPYPFDRHPDHIQTGNLVREAIFFSGLARIKTGALKPFRPRRTFYYRSAVDIPLSFVFDITGTYEKKINALRCFKTQFHDVESKMPETFISTKLFEYEIESRARHFGFKIGVEFGEPFYCYEPLKAETESLFMM